MVLENRTGEKIIYILMDKHAHLQNGNPFLVITYQRKCRLWFLITDDRIPWVGLDIPVKSQARAMFAVSSVTVKHNILPYLILCPSLLIV